MKNQTVRRLKFAALLALAGFFTGLSAQAASNFYTSPSSGKWETATNWSLGAPGTSNSIYITNSGTKTITIDATTAFSFTNTLTIADLTVSAPTNSYTNTLFLNNAGTGTPLHVVSNLTILPGGALTISNSALTVDVGTTPLTLPNGSEVQVDGSVTAINSILNASNALYFTVGAMQSGFGHGILNMTNSTFTPHQLSVGNYSDGTASFINCTTILGTGFGVGAVSGHAGNVSIVGGLFIATNTHSGFFANLVQIGDRGVANVTISSNANVQFGGTTIGDIRGSSGTLTLLSGTNTLDKVFLGLDSEPGPPGPTASGSIFVGGGLMSVSELHIGSVATGLVTVANGTLIAPVVAIGETNSATGAFNISGGTAYVTSLLKVGSNALAHASVSVTGGALYVTNSTGTALAILNGGTLFQGAGIFKADNLVITNGGSVVTISNYLVNYTATISSGGLTVSNATLGIANNGTTNSGAGVGIVTVSNATVNAAALTMGSTTGGQGFLNLQSNSVVNVVSNFTAVSGSISSTSTVTVAKGSSLNVSNGTISLGSAGNAQMNIAGGVVIAKTVRLGGINSAGGVCLSAGQLKVAGLLSNFILVDGGDLDGTGGNITIGEGHNAAMQMDSGTSRCAVMFVGYSPGFTGTFTQNGGIVNVFTNLIVGDCSSGALGVPTMNGGTMYVTNAAHTAVLDVRNGTFTLNAGATLVVDTLVVTNACGQFIKNGGTLIQNNPPILTGSLDADGDGQSNAAEAAAGTDPFDAASSFKVISIARTNGTSMRLDWTTVGGHSYAVQTNSSPGGGTFNNLSPLIVVPGTASGTTNYVHTNGAAAGSRFYRVRLGP